jgi:pyruvate/2-oxoglutarate dehydrogenase complex dihydrolipoamide dehydrogenase (E3) component
LLLPRAHATISRIAGLERVSYFTKETISGELKSALGSLVTLGGGSIDCEPVGRLGLRVAILQRRDRILGKEYEGRRASYSSRRARRRRTV